MNGIVILGTLPGSAAERLGLRNGDVLLAVNGEAMSSVEDFLRARAQVKERMQVLVRRGDHVLDLTIDLTEKAPPEGLERVAADMLRPATPKPSSVLN